MNRRSVENLPGQSKQISPEDEFKLQPLHVISCNIRSLLGKIGELSHLLEMFDVHVVCIQETWLDASVQSPALPNFRIISRRDRSNGPNRGGVLTYARNDMNSCFS